MNYIKKIQQENEALKEGINLVIGEFIELQKYLNSDKFNGIENDYIHVKTDIYPKITAIKTILQSL
jgi:hypothetical protein